MFSRRLTWALVVMAIAAVAQCAVALWSVGKAEMQQQRGRIAGDIHFAFAQLTIDVERLAGNPADQAALVTALHLSLDRLDRLAAQSQRIDDGDAARAVQAERDAALKGIRAQLAPGVANAPVDPDVASLRELLLRSLDREAAALASKREAANDALSTLRVWWLLATAAIGGFALLAAAYFARALRRPLRALEDGALALQRGDLGHRIGLAGRDEFASLAGHVDAMAHELAGHRQREADARAELEHQVQARTQDLSQALQAMRAAEERRRRLFADVSHELRTPTTVIRGEAEVTLRGQPRPAEEYQAALRRIAESARQLGLVIDDLLTVARSDLDALSLRSAPLDLRAPFAQAVAQVGTVAIEQGVHLEPGLPVEALPIEGDVERLRQVMTVMLDNAVRYSHRGGTVRARAQRVDSPSPRVVVEVEDEGIGIDPQEVEQAFEHGWRGKLARVHRADGIGLGLAIARALARGHGGDVGLAPRPGGGTVATLWLPLSRGAAGAAA